MTHDQHTMSAAYVDSKHIDPSAQKKKTRVSDLISRLSSSTAASRAKADGAKPVTGIGAGGGAGAPKTHRHFSYNSYSSQSTPTFSGNTNSAELARKLSGNVSTNSRIPSPWGSVQLNNGIKGPAIGGSPAKLNKLVKTQSASAHIGKLQDTEASKLPGESNATTPDSNYKRVSYTGGLVPNSAPPTTGLPSLHRASGLSPSPMTPKRGSDSTSSLNSNLFPTKTVRARMSLGSTYGTSIMGGESRSRVEDLRSKIYELEAVLEAERAGRDCVEEWADQIKSLSEALARERTEKDALKRQLTSMTADAQAQLQQAQNDTDGGEPSQDRDSRITKYSQRLSTNSSQGGLRYSSASLSPLVSEADTLADCCNDEMKVLNAYLPSEHIHDTQDSINMEDPNFDSKPQTPENNVSRNYELEINNTHILRLETSITMLKADNSALRRETEASHHVLQEKENYINHLKGKIETLTKEATEAKNQVSNKQLEMVTDRAKIAGLEAIIRSKEDHIKILETSNKQKIIQLDESKKELEQKEKIVQESIETRERESAENSELKNQLRVFQTSRKPMDDKMQALERDYRLAQRTIENLEVALQDVQLSVEEREIENDELNRSIQAVMDQAKQAIGSASKRHSILSTTLSPMI